MLSWNTKGTTKAHYQQVDRLEKVNFTKLYGRSVKLCSHRKWLLKINCPETVYSELWSLFCTMEEKTGNCFVMIGTIGLSLLQFYKKSAIRTGSCNHMLYYHVTNQPFHPKHKAFWQCRKFLSDADYRFITEIDGRGNTSIFLLFFALLKNKIVSNHSK